MTKAQWTSITETPVPKEVLIAAEEWFEAHDKVKNWEAFFEHLEGMTLADGTLLDFGPSMLSPAIRAIKKHLLERY